MLVLGSLIVLGHSVLYTMFPSLPSIATKSSLVCLDRVQKHLHSFAGDELFSTLQPEMKYHKTLAALSLLPWHVF